MNCSQIPSIRSLTGHLRPSLWAKLTKKERAIKCLPEFRAQLRLILLSLHILVYKCFKIVLIVLIVNSVVSELKRFVKIDLVTMSVSALRDYTKAIIFDQLIILFSIS